MQQLARDEDGDLWELDAQGNAVRLVQPATPQSKGRVFSLAPNPKEVRQEARQEKQDARADRREDRAEDTAARQAQNDAIANQLKQMELKLKEAELRKTGGENRAGALRSLVGQINRVQELFKAGPGSTDGLGAVKDYLPTSANRAFDAAGASLSQQGLAAFRVPGTGTVSDRDAIMFDKANLPQASAFDSATAEQLRGLRARVEEEYRTLGIGAPKWEFLEDAQAGKAEQKADNELPNPTNGADLKPPPNYGSDDQVPPSGPTLEVASGPTREVYDARLSSTLDSLLNAGASEATITAVLKRAGYSPTPGQYAQVKAWMKANPGKRYFGAQASRTEDMNLLQRAAGSETGAFLAHMANNATAGIPAALAGPEGQGALDAMAAANPKSAMAGGVVGGVTGAMGGEALVAARAPAALARYAPRIADAIYGSLLGFNTAQEGEGLTGAATGAVAGLAGGFLGDRAMRGLGATVRGVRDPAVQYLQGRGIPLTVGQAVGNSGRVGATVKKIEDSLTSVPFVGNMVDARRMEGLRGFNRAAFETAGEQVAGQGVTETGAEGIQQLRGMVGNAYDNALNPVRIDLNDPQYVADAQNIIASINRIPPVNGAREAAASAIQSRIDDAAAPYGSTLTGRSFQEAYRGLARTGRERANGDYGYEIGQVMRQGQDALTGALERQNPGAFDAFRAANSTNRNANVLADAVNKASRQEDELFTPAQLSMADASSARRLTGPMASAAGERPFHELSMHGQSVLPSKLPDSGTATRAMTGLALGGGLGAGGGYLAGDTGAGASAGLGATLMLALGGSRPAQQAMVRGLTQRPDELVRVGDQLVRRADIGGWTGAGVLSSLLSAQ